MGINRGGTRTLILGCVLIFAAPLAWSADDTSVAAATVSNNQSFNAPPEFRAMATMQLGNMMSCFTTPILQGIGTAFTDGMKAGAKALGAGAQACPGGEFIPSTDRLECSSFKDRATGEFSYDRWEKMNKELQAAAETFSCKKNQIEAMKTQLGCLSTQADLLAQQVASLQSAYTQNIQRMQQDTAKLTALEEDRKAQLEDVSGKLTGKTADGSKGLLGVREEMQQAIAAMPGKIQQVKEDQLEVVRMRQSLEEMAQSRTVVLANSCFTRIRPSFKCTPNGKPVNAREYVLCRYKQNRKIGPKGVIQEGEVAEKQAEAKTKELETILDSILDESPTDPAKVKSAEDQQLAANKPIKILTVSDLETRYGSQLAQFNGNGLDIRQFISQTMGSCFGEAKKSVSRERSIVNSGLAQMQENIKKKERATSVMVNELLNGYAQIHSDAMAALTGQHLPLNVSNCQSAKPEIQLSCLSDVRRNMEGLLSGTTPNSTMDIMIKGQSAATNISFKCQGLNGCITYMQNAQRNLQQEVKKVGQFKKDYILKANQSVESFTKQMASTMSTQSQALSTKLKELNSTLAMLGVRPGIDIKPVRGKKLTKGEDGLYEMPENVVDLIGGQMSPPMLDVQGETFASALDGISRRMEDLKDKEGELTKASQEMAQIPDECQSDLARRLGTEFGELDKCLSNVEDCADINLSPLDELVQSMSGMNLSSDSTNISEVLSSGLNRCNSIRQQDITAKLAQYETCQSAYRAFKDAPKADDNATPEAKKAAAEVKEAALVRARAECSGLTNGGLPITSVDSAKEAKDSYEKELERSGIKVTAKNTSCKNIASNFMKKGTALANISKAGSKDIDAAK